MFLGGRRLPPVWTMVATLVGGALAAGGANTLNSISTATSTPDGAHRPSPAGDREVSPRNALVFGWVLSVLSVLWLALTTNVLSAVLAAGAIFFYVVIYTWGSSAAPRRTSSGVALPGASRCSSAGRR